MNKVVEFIKDAADKCREVGMDRFRDIDGIPPDDPALLEMAKLLDEIGLNLELKLKIAELMKAKGVDDGKIV